VKTPRYQLVIRQTASFPDLQATTPFPGRHVVDRPLPRHLQPHPTPL